MEIYDFQRVIRYLKNIQKNFEKYLVNSKISWIFVLQNTNNMTTQVNNQNLELTFNSVNNAIVKNEYLGFSLYTKEISLGHYITIGIDINGNKIICESKPNERKMSMEKAQSLIYKFIK